MTTEGVPERLARAQGFLSRGEHEAAWEELSGADAAAEARGDGAALKRIAGMAKILAARTKGGDKLRAENLYRSALAAQTKAGDKPHAENLYRPAVKIPPLSEGSTTAATRGDKPGRTSRYVAVFAFAILGALITRGWYGYAIGRLERPQTGGSSPIASLFGGAIHAFVTLAIVGSIGYFVFVRGKAGKSWSDVTFGRTAMGITLVLLFTQSIGSAVDHNSAVNKPYETWLKTHAPLLREFNTANTQDAQFRRMAKREGYTMATRELAIKISIELSNTKTRWAALPPSSDKDLRAIEAGVANSLRLANAGYDDYVLSLETSASVGSDKRTNALLDSGDTKFFHALALMSTIRKKLTALEEPEHPQPGHQPAMALREPTALT